MLLSESEEVQWIISDSESEERLWIISDSLLKLDKAMAHSASRPPEGIQGEIFIFIFCLETLLGAVGRCVIYLGWFWYHQWTAGEILTHFDIRPASESWKLAILEHHHWACIKEFDYRVPQFLLDIIRISWYHHDIIKTSLRYHHDIMISSRYHDIIIRISSKQH